MTSKDKDMRKEVNATNDNEKSDAFLLLQSSSSNNDASVRTGIRDTIAADGCNNNPIQKQKWEGTGKQQHRPRRHKSKDHLRTTNDLLVELNGNADEINKYHLRHAVHCAGLWAYGVVFVECWVLKEDENKLYRAPGGFWRDPAFEATDSLRRLEDQTKFDYVPPHPLGPQEGLAGVLWSETSTTTPRRRRVMSGLPSMPNLARSDFTSDAPDHECTSSSPRGRLQDLFGALPSSNWFGNQNENNNNEDEIQSIDDDVETPQNPPVDSGINSAADYRKVAWRDLNHLAQDPDQPPNLRLQLLSEAGFGLAAGVPFNVRGHRGIVVYMARSTVETTKLQSPTNEAYLRGATTLIGAQSALGPARKASVEARQAEREEAYRRTKKKMSLIAGILSKQGKKGLQKERSKLSLDLPTSLEKQNNDDKEGGGTYDDNFIERRKLGIAQKIKVWAKKCLGQNINPPPPMPLSQTIWTFFGVFVTVIVLFLLSSYISVQTGGKYKMLFPSLGALTTLQYGLTGAPASQPRNAIYGQVVSMIIALSFSYIPNEYMTSWLRTTLVTSFAVTSMVKLGIVHPPAGATAMLFSFGGHDWISFGLVLLGNVISIIAATLINNMSTKRQYPSYWAFFHVPEDFSCTPATVRKKKKKKDGKMEKKLEMQKCKE